MPTERHPPIDGWSPPSASERRLILDTCRSIAIVGASSNPARASNFVATYLLGIKSGYEVYLVNPRESEILGQRVYPSLEAVPIQPDIVDVFRRPEELPDIADEAIAVGASVLWIQLGLWSAEAARRATAGDLRVVMDRCLKIEHARFSGSLGLAGFDTGVISSRRPVR